MIMPNIPTDKFPGLAYDGSMTFAGIIQAYFTIKDATGQNVGISQNWSDSKAAQHQRDYVRRILPAINRLYGAQKPMHEFRMETINAILAELVRTHHYEDSTEKNYRRLLLYAYNMGVAQNEYQDNIHWDMPEEDDESNEQSRIQTLTKLRKSFGIEEDLRMLQWFCSLDPTTASGEDIGLALMYFLGVRDNEACGASFGNFKLMPNYPDMAIFTVSNTTSIDSNELKPSGKTINAPRRLPLCILVYQFINARKKVVQHEINAGRITLPAGIDSVDKLPLVCRGNRYTCRADTHDISKAGRKLFPQIGIEKSELKWLFDRLMSEDFRDNILDEKDPTPYLLRRNTATRLYHLGFSWEDIQYWIAHDIESVHNLRNFYADEVTLYELGRDYERHPIFSILADMLGNSSARSDGITAGAANFNLEAGTPTLLHIVAREPNAPISITAHSEAPFTVAQTAKENNESPENLISIDYMLHEAYWKVYNTLQKITPN